MEALSNAHEEQLHVQKVKYECGFNQTTKVIENRRIGTRKTAESLNARAFEAKNAETREIFDRQRAGALGMRRKVARLEA